MKIEEGGEERREPIFVMGDFNINLLGVETCNYAHNFLLSLQSFSLIPTIDKTTRVYKNTATLIDNILVHILDAGIYSGNIVSVISAQYKIYRNKILILSYLSKKLYYHNYFSQNLTNMKNTWDGIN